MSYEYKAEEPKLYTKSGMRVYVAIRDAMNEILATAGAARSGEVMDRATKKLGAADTWVMLAALDRMVEEKEIREVSTNTMGQHRIFVSTSR